MKKIIFFFLLLLITNISIAQWIQVSDTLYISSFAKSGNNLIASTTGIYVSTNNGNNWALYAFSSTSINTLAVSGNSVFGAAFYGGLYMSTNNGINWPSTPQNSMSINGLEINQSYLYTAGGLGGGFYRSSNNGINWSEILPAGYLPYALAVKDSNIFASYIDNIMYNAFVVRSTNNGNSWTELASGLPNDIISCIGFSNLNVFAGCCNRKIYYSTNNGTIWYLSTLNNLTTYCFSYIGDNVFIASDYGFWLSTNNGLNWIQKDEGFTGHPIIKTLFIANNYIFASSGRIWRRPLSELITGFENNNLNLPDKYFLYQNYPNPFNPITKIDYDLPKDGNVKLIIYDIIGREIKSLVNEFKQAGNYTVEFNGNNLASGIYFYKIQVEGGKRYTTVKKMILLK
jgi:hypothetical protein